MKYALIIVGILVLAGGAYYFLQKQHTSITTMNTPTPTPPSNSEPTPPSSSGAQTTGSGLQIEVLKTGAGDAVKAGDVATVHYTGWLTNGTKFDSSLDRGQPFQFRLGAGMVIAGWDEGVNGMKIGEKRKLTIPANLGYGARGAGDVIPPNATLVFEVELLKIN
jgi:FKBP-type peptidyl-prolyl cis-trans isomerase